MNKEEIKKIIERDLPDWELSDISTAPEQMPEVEAVSPPLEEMKAKYEAGEWRG